MIRITLERSGYRAWTGALVGPKTIVKTFRDHMDAAQWFISDSYFDETYTKKATWEIVEDGEDVIEL